MQPFVEQFETWYWFFSSALLYGPFLPFLCTSAHTWTKIRKVLIRMLMHNWNIHQTLMQPTEQPSWNMFSMCYFKRILYMVLKNKTKHSSKCFVFHRRKKVFQVWNKMRLSKWCQNLFFIYLFIYSFFLWTFFFSNLLI